jgi:hypothetical protein
LHRRWLSYIRVANWAWVVQASPGEGDMPKLTPVKDVEGTLPPTFDFGVVKS